MNLEQELKKMASDEQPSAILKEKTIQRMEQETQNYLKPKWKPVLLASILIIVLVGTAYAAGWLD